MCAQIVGKWPLLVNALRASTLLKVKCTLVQAQGLRTGRTVHRGSRGIALLFHDHGTRRGVRGQRHARPLFTPGKDPVPIVQEFEWAPGSVWTGAENLAHTGIRSPDRPARIQSLYRLSYPAPMYVATTMIFSFKLMCHAYCCEAKSKRIVVRRNMVIRTVVCMPNIM